MPIPYLTRSRLIAVISAGGVLLFVLLVLVWNFFTQPTIAPKLRLTLNVWGIFQDKDILDYFAKAYHEANPNVTVKYRNFGSAEFADYEPQILNTLAAGDGPDIFFINNTWLPRYLSALTPAPPSELAADDIREDFVDAVGADFVVDGKVYGAPLSLDALALFWNREMFNTAGIAGPPATWLEFVDNVARLRIINPDSSIGRAGAALGTAENIHRSTDVLSLLMIQNGCPMVDPVRGRARFTDTSNDGTVYPCAKALDFYTSFAKPGDKHYTWNRRLNYSLDAFYKQSEGNVAMIFDYAYSVAGIQKKAPYLDFGVAPLPQISVEPGAAKINYANYWAPVVAKRTIERFDDAYKRRGGDGCAAADNKTLVPAGPCWYAWDFIKFMLRRDNAQYYLEQTQLPAAQRSLIDWQKANVGANLKVFADAVLTARNWYQPDSNRTEQYLADAINDVLLRNLSSTEALQRVKDKIEVLFKK